MSIERGSKYYNDAYKIGDDYKLPYTESPYYEMWQIVLSLISNDTTIIELGCGTGQFSKMCEDAGKKYLVGYDFSQEAISIAKEIHNNDKCVLGDIYKVDLWDSSTIVALEVFEHVKDFKLIENIGLGREVIFSVPDFNDASHIRYFHSINEVVARYSNVIKFEYIQKFQKWYICKGVTI